MDWDEYEPPLFNERDKELVDTMTKDQKWEWVPAVTEHKIKGMCVSLMSTIEKDEYNTRHSMILDDKIRDTLHSAMELLQEEGKWVCYNVLVWEPLNPKHPRIEVEMKEVDEATSQTCCVICVEPVLDIDVYGWLGNDKDRVRKVKRRMEEVYTIWDGGEPQN